MTKITIIIINYKTAELTLQCIRSVLQFEKELSIEIILVDNNSEDDIESLTAGFPEVKFIQMGYNAGFSRANNAGLRLATGEYILLLNSDTYLIEVSTLNKCIDFLNSKAGKVYDILGCNLLNKDGSFQISARNEFPGVMRVWRANPLFLFFTRRQNIIQRLKEKNHALHQKTGTVGWINGAFLLFKGEIIRKYNLFFDEDFFLYGEDVEWCHRAKKQKLRFVHFNKVSLIHLASASSKTSQIKKMQVLLSDWLYLRKQRGRVYLFFVLLLHSLNLIMDRSLSFQARMRGKELSSNEKEYSTQMNKIIAYLIKKYAITLIFFNGFSSERFFTLNCYKNDRLFAKGI